MQKRSERFEELDVRRLTIQTEALRLPMRSEGFGWSRALRESLRKQELLQSLDVVAATVFAQRSMAEERRLTA